MLSECFWERSAPNESGIKVLSTDERNQCPNIGNNSKMIAASQNQPPHPTFHLWPFAYQGQREEKQEEIKMSSSWPLLTLFPTTYSLFTLQCFLATSDPCIPGAGAGEGGEGDKKSRTVIILIMVSPQVSRVKAAAWPSCPLSRLRLKMLLPEQGENFRPNMSTFQSSSDIFKQISGEGI